MSQDTTEPTRQLARSRSVLLLLLPCCGSSDDAKGPNRPNTLLAYAKQWRPFEASCATTAFGALPAATWDRPDILALGPHWVQALVPYLCDF